MLSSLKYRLGRLVEQHPYTWFLAWRLIHKLSFLLPHDKSYFALQYFCPFSEGAFVDVGANSGISALSFRKLNSTIPIISLEPNPLHEPNLKKLKKTLSLFDYKLVGLSDAKTELTFYTPVYSGVVLHTFTSTRENQVVSAVERAFGSRIAKKIRLEKVKAPIMCFDELDIHPGIIKIDAEGHDFEVLLGAEKSIKQYRPFVMVEICHSDLERFCSFFSKLSYKLLIFNYPTPSFTYLDKTHCNINFKNIFAVPEEKVKLLPVC